MINIVLNFISKIVNYGVTENDDEYNRISKKGINIVILISLITSIVTMFVVIPSVPLLNAIYTLIGPYGIFHLLFIYSLYLNSRGKIHITKNFFPTAITLDMVAIQIVHGGALLDTIIICLVLAPIYYICRPTKFLLKTILVIIFNGLMPVFFFFFPKLRYDLYINILGMDIYHVVPLTIPNLTLILITNIIFVSMVIFFRYLSKSQEMNEYKIRNLMDQLLIQNKELDRLNHELTSRVVYLNAEIEVASRIQLNMLPKDAEKENVLNFNIYTFLKPYSEVAGDYYDFMMDRDNNEWFIIGDVSGHGLGSGLFMFMAQTSFILLIKNNIVSTPRDLIINMHNLLKYNLQHRINDKDYNYMTLTVLKHIGNNKFIVSGSHMDIILINKDTGITRRIPTNSLGVPIGNNDVVADVTKETIIELENEMIFLYTDGLTELIINKNKKMLGLKKLILLIETLYDKNDRPDIFIKKLIDHISSIDCNLKDDLTIVIIDPLEFLPLGE